jgi:hypothetical protein
VLGLVDRVIDRRKPVFGGDTRTEDKVLSLFGPDRYPRGQGTQAE